MTASRATLKPDGNARLVVQIKERPLRSERYRKIVASLPCDHCGIEGYSQAAHGDQGKGMAIKTDDRTCYPLCGPRPTAAGCHYLIGTAALYSKEERRAYEKAAALRTAAKVKALGLWPEEMDLW